MTNEFDRRALLKAGALAAMPEAMFGGHGNILHEVAVAGRDVDEKPEHSIKFSVIGLDHDHILAMTEALKGGGGELVSVFSKNEKGLADFRARFGDVPLARSEDEILNDANIKLVASASILNERAPLGIRVMQHGKDFLSDKPGMTTLEQLEDVRRALKETGKLYGILYSERLGVRASVKAGELVKAGAIGKVIQTINIAPHQVKNNKGPRPDWFWDPARFGGILCDIGSHQADQFVFYTGSTRAEVVAARIGNINHPQHAQFQDFGDMMLQGNGGMGYVRVDWFTPDGLGMWGDGRLFILGTEGYIEVRKYVDIAGRKAGNHLFIVDQKQTRYIDCKDVELPFGRQFVADVVNRTHNAQDQEQTLLAMELVLNAQKNAKRYESEA